MDVSIQSVVSLMETMMGNVRFKARGLPLKSRTYLSFSFYGYPDAAFFLYHAPALCHFSNLPKSNLLRQPKSSAEHALLGRHISNIMDLHLGHVRRESVSHLPRQLLANFLLLLDVVLALGAETVHMHHGHLAIGKQRLDLVDAYAGHVCVQSHEA